MDGKLYQAVRRAYYWPGLAADCYKYVLNCPECARERVKLQRGTRPLQLFPATEPLAEVAMDILGPLIATPRGNRFILVIVDRFTKLTQAIPLPSKSAYCIGRAFTTHWVFKYGIPKTVLTDNAEEFTGSFLTEVHHIVGCKGITTTTYHPQTNGQTERFNRTILAALRTYVDDHPADWDLYTDSFAFAYNTQPHTSTSVPPFELVLSRPPAPLAIESIPHVVNPRVEDHNKWLQNLKVRISAARQQLGKAQQVYKRNYDRRLRKRRQQFKVNGFVFLRREPGETVPGGSHKLTPVATGPFRVAEVKEKTAVILRPQQGRRHALKEEVSLDRLEPAPPPRGTSEPQPPATADRPSPVRPGKDLVLRDIRDHRQAADEPPGHFEFLCRWVGFAPGEDLSWEPIQHLRYSQVQRYARRKKLGILPNMGLARAG